MPTLDGLFLYELVMLVLGALLFLSLLLMLILGKSPSKAILYYGIAVVMMGFPGIKSIQITEGMITINRDEETLQKDPTDKTARSDLQANVLRYQGRSFKDPNHLITVARGQIAMGDNTAAEANVTKALQLSPKFASAETLKARLDLDRQLSALTAQVEQNPGDGNAKSELQKTVIAASSQPIASPATIANVARAQLAIGDTAQAKTNVDKALLIDSNLATAKALQSRIATIQRQTK